MNKRLFTLCIALMAVTVSAVAETLKVGNKTISVSTSQSSITPTGLSKGTIKWDAGKKTLTFTNVELNSTQYNAVEYDGGYINLVFEGKNVIQSKYFDFKIKVSSYCTISGSNAYLELESNNTTSSVYDCIWMIGEGDLMIRNIYLKATSNTGAAISSSGRNPLSFQTAWAQLKTNASGKIAVEKFTDCQISSGSYVETGAWSETSKTFVSGSTALAEVNILPNLTVGGTIVDTDQYEYGFDPKGKTGGSIYFEDDGFGKPTLTFNAVKGQMGSTDLPSPYGSSLVYNKNIENLTIMIANANTLSAVSGATETRGIYSAKPLIVKGYDSSASLTYTGAYDGISCDDDLEIKDLTMNITGKYPIKCNNGNMIINNCTITATTTVTESDADAIWGYCTLTGCGVLDGYYKYGLFYGYDGKVLSTVKIVPLADIKIDINVTNFPDDNFRKYLLSQDYGNDGVLTQEEIQNLTRLTVINKGIEDLKGVELFTALTMLVCNSNSLKSLDVSNNPALEILGCASNNLTSLDITKNPMLRELDCSGNQIKRSDMDDLVNNLPEKQGILAVCDDAAKTDNLISKAQVKVAKDKGWKVKKFVLNEDNSRSLVDYDGIELIIINSLTFPDKVFREYLTSQDYGKDDILTEDEIKGITSLDVSNQSIHDLTGIAVFTALKTLKCGRTDIKSLDVSKNTALTELYCHLNELESLDVSKNTALTTLHCGYDLLTSLDISKNKALKLLYCQCNMIEGANMDDLVSNLPDTQGTLVVCQDNSYPNNIITQAQVKVATDKGWKVQKVAEDDNHNVSHVDYAGLGDVNGDNKISQADLDLLVKIIMGQLPDNVKFYAGDLNNDGKTDAADVVVMVNILNGK